MRGVKKGLEREKREFVNTNFRKGLKRTFRFPLLVKAVGTLETLKLKKEGEGDSSIRILERREGF